MLKIVDRYLILSFLPPFVATFFIALFVLILQVLWVYIDDIIGKGSSLFFILEMVFYLSMTMIPLALPIAVLISSVMVMGNLAERYELSSLKSAGVSLSRAMRPLIALSLVVSLFSFISSNYLIPVANLKGKTRLYDVRKQKPNLNLEAGVFNEDFEGYVIYAGRKSQDGRHIYDVLVYPWENSRMLQVITAESGRLYTTPDQKFLVMELQNGWQFQEVEPDGPSNNRPFLRTEFSRWEKLFDLSEFDLERTDEGSFRDNASVMTLPQIRLALDSVYIVRNERIHAYRQQVAPYLDPGLTRDTATSEALLSRFARAENPDAAQTATTGFQAPLIDQVQPVTKYGEVEGFHHTFAEADRSLLLTRARTLARSVQGEAASADRVIKEIDKSAAKFRIETHLKYSVALMCMIFLFIGAPMGAIVRKGGFGYPLLIAICFFMVFMVLNMAFKSMAEKLIISPFWGAWMPCFILLPVGVFLTQRAMTDAKIVDVDRFIAPVFRVFNFLKIRYGRKNANPVP